MYRVSKKYIIIDGYNFINYDKFLVEKMKISLESARVHLNDILSEYVAYSGEIGIVVYDATKSGANKARVDAYHNIEVVFTKGRETADSYIERLVDQLASDKTNLVRVVTLDWAEQQLILGRGAIRVSASEWRREINTMKRDVKDVRGEEPLKKGDGTSLDQETLNRLESLLK